VYHFQFERTERADLSLRPHRDDMLEKTCSTLQKS